MVEDNNERSRLQQRITADLRKKSKASSKDEQIDVDLVEDSEMLKATQKTSRFSWFWFILVFLAVCSLVVIFILK